jgi:hypothetical protein
MSRPLSRCKDRKAVANPNWVRVGMNCLAAIPPVIRDVNLGRESGTVKRVGKVSGLFENSEHLAFFDWVPVGDFIGQSRHDFGVLAGEVHLLR